MRDRLSAVLSDAGRDLVLGSGCVGCGEPGRVLCPVCRASLPARARPAWPTPTPPGLVAPYAAGSYGGLLRSLVIEHKEHGVFALAVPLGDVLAAVVAGVAGVGADRPVVLVPVPSRRPVVRRRGHDPLLRVARHAAGRLRRQGLPVVVRRALTPAGRVRDQAGLSAAERAANLSGSMVCRRPGELASGRRLVVIVDDVITTGATLREAQRALEEAAVPVHAVAAVAATRRRGEIPGRSLPRSGPGN